MESEMPDHEELVAHVLQLGSEEERAAWLLELESEAPEVARIVAADLERLSSLGLAVEREEAPRRVGRFMLEARVGVGGMGEVWRAREVDPTGDESSAPGRLVAVKLVRPELLWFEGAHRRFEREARAASRLDHPSVVSVLDFGSEDGLPWLALEWVGGASLEAVLDGLRSRAPATVTPAEFQSLLLAVSLERGRRPRTALEGDTYPELVALLLARIADGLHHAHARGVIHRDVKPSNVLVEPCGRVLLVDFGLARSEENTRLTRSGTWLGSLPYASPEQLVGETIDRRGDVYSLGATLYECLTLRTPFLGGSEAQIRRRIEFGDLEPIRRLNPAVSVELERVCRAAMDPDRRRRHATAEELAADLRRAAEGSPVRARRLPARVRAARWARTHARTATAAVVALLLLGIAVAWALRERQHVTRIQRMGDATLVERLDAESNALGPPDRGDAESIEGWLERADEVIARRPRHVASLQRLRRRGESSAARDGEGSGAARERLLGLRLELEGLARHLAEASAAPADPDRAANALGRWSAELDRNVDRFVASTRSELDALEALVARRSPLEGDQLEDLRRLFERAADDYATRTTWRFEAEFDQWRHDELERLVARLDRLSERREEVLALRTNQALIAAAATGAATEWRELAREVEASPPYGGRTLVPQPGLRPLRVNPTTGLAEFVLVGTGELPRAAPTPADPGRLAVDASTGIVLVLLPGGVFEMGAPPGCDLVAFRFALPRHPVRLAPFLVSKFELTVAQARRLGPVPESALNRLEDGAMPLRVDWAGARALLRTRGLEHPTEAQWEYAVGAGRRSAGASEDEREFPAALLPVGVRSPNEFGLYDGLGNVGEWCREWFIGRAYSTLLPRPGDGLRDTAFEGAGRAVRGGNFTTPLEDRSVHSRGKGTPAVAPATGARPVLNVVGSILVEPAQAGGEAR